MARRKRKLQEDATQPNEISYGQDAINLLTEFALHLDLQIRESERIKLSKVRIGMVDRKIAKILLDLLRRVIDGYR